MLALATAPKSCYIGLMRYGIVADIHSNLTAFQAVLADMENRGGVAELWCLGDVVGYGPDPRQCIELLRKHNHVAVAGNHDWAAIGKMDTSLFNPDAATAAHWTTRQLTTEDKQYLESLPLTAQLEDFTLVHGSPRDPIFEYLLSNFEGKQNFAYFETRFCLVGHSHTPAVFERDKEGNCSLTEFPAETPIVLAKNRLIINPGGVGQPRNSDPLASYAIYDSEARTVTRHCVAYDISATQSRMVAQRLPRRLIMRLSYGI